MPRHFELGMTQQRTITSDSYHSSRRQQHHIISCHSVLPENANNSITSRTVSPIALVYPQQNHQRNISSHGIFFRGLVSSFRRTFCDCDDMSDFHHFRLQEHSQVDHSAISLVVLFAFFTLTFCFWLSLLVDAYQSVGALITIVSMIAIVISFIGFAFYVVLKILNIKLWSNTHMGRMETLLLFMLSFCGELFIIQLIIMRKDYNHVSEYMKTETLPEAISIVTMMIPSILYLVFKGVRFRNVIYSIGCSFACDIYLMTRYGLNQSWIPMALALIFSLFMISEYHRQCLNNFLITRQLQQAMGENHRMAEEIKSSELRHMIGNVAHDLKTPLSSFISGIDVIQNVAKDLLGDLEKLRKTSQPEVNQSDMIHVTEKVSTILEVAENVTNTNAFMIMTINRCIDYNKTLFGLKLSPKPEVFVLKESLEFTVKCLKNSYDQVSIICEYFGEGLKGGDIMIRTDKQWLQENLLCLVGNGAKYSERGSSVKVSVFVVAKMTKVIPNSLNSSSPSSAESLAAPSIAATHLHDSAAALVAMEEGMTNSPSRPTFQGFNHGNLSKGSPQQHNGTFAAPPISSSPSSITGRQVGQVDSTSAARQYFLKFTVLDTGSGISPEFYEKLFEEPAQAARINGGTGLGLYSLANRVEALGGEYGVQNRMDIDGRSGTQFWFTIPFEEASANNVGNGMGNRRASRLLSPDEFRNLPGNSAPNSAYRSATRSLHASNDESPANVKTPDTTIPVVLKSNLPSRSESRETENIASSVVRFPTIPRSDSVYKEDNSPTSVYFERLAFVGSASASASASGNSAFDAFSHSSKGHVGAIHELSSGSTAPLSSSNDAQSIGNKAGDKNVNKMNLAGYKKLHVLVVDDSPVITKMASLALRKQGYKVSLAENGQQAVDKVTEMIAAIERSPLSGKTLVEKIDVILMDFQMPVMDGIEGIRVIDELLWSERVRLLEPQNAAENAVSRCTCNLVPPQFDRGGALPITSISRSFRSSRSALPAVVLPFSRSDSSSVRLFSAPANAAPSNLPPSLCVFCSCFAPIIIGFSAKSDESQIQVAYDNGMDAFMPKPFTINAFQNILNGCLEPLNIDTIESGKESSQEFGSGSDKQSSRSFGRARRHSKIEISSPPEIASGPII